jgi:hypothetical protein
MHKTKVSVRLCVCVSSQTKERISVLRMLQYPGQLSCRVCLTLETQRSKGDDQQTAKWGLNLKSHLTYHILVTTELTS